MVFNYWHAGHTINIRQPYGSCRLPNSSTCKSWNITKHDHLIHHIYHITSWPYHITNPCKNKLDASNIVVANFYVVWGFRRRTVSNLRTKTTTLIQVLSNHRCKSNLNYGGRDRHPPAANQVRNQSRVSLRVMSVRAASSHHPARCKVHESEAITKTSTPTKPLCSTRAIDLRIKTALIPL